MERFALSDAQAQAIVDMRLRALTGLERSKLEAEYKELQERIAELKAILADEKRLLTVIKEEISAISEKYGDDRKTTIGFDEYDISMEDLIPVTNTVITFTKLGYIKRMNVDNFQGPAPGRKGNQGCGDHRRRLHQGVDDDHFPPLSDVLYQPGKSLPSEGL